MHRSFLRDATRGRRGESAAQKAPDLGDKAQTRGTPYAGKAFFAGEGARRERQIRFLASKVPAGRQKKGIRCAGGGLQFLKSFSRFGSFIFPDPINNKT